MKNVKVVIGAGYGDEGKGLMTDFFSAMLSNPIVVRFNGGAQAGHTVWDNHNCNIFSHLGSGSLTGAPTYFAQPFICNPIEFNPEYDMYCERNTPPLLYAHPDSIVTTPFDMIINQEKERQRGKDKHGSTGVGVWETILRSVKFKITVKDLRDKRFLRKTLTLIRDYWVKDRAEDLNWDHVPSIFTDDRLIENFIEDCQIFRDRITEVIDDSILDRFDNVVFEGAQGLLLGWDQNPTVHATPSYTGMHNVSDILKKFNVENLEVCYVTRCYMTRHGAGPFATECPKPYSTIEDLTNQPNAWQGTIRYGLLDLDLLQKTIESDWQFAPVGAKKVLAITCLDQLDNDVLFIKEGKLHKENIENFEKIIGNSLGVNKMYLSYGPSRKTIVLAKKEEQI